MNVAAREPTDTPLMLDDIQGNIIGFLKDHQYFLFLRFPDGRTPAVVQWLREITPRISTGAQVLEFNKGFKERKTRQGGRDGLKATWRNLAFTFQGLEALGAPNRDEFPEDFREGMRARAEQIGDVGKNGPEHWVFPEDGGPIHALLLLAADSRDDLIAEVASQDRALNAAGISVVFRQSGEAQEGSQRGHEHFGFKDGVSQPGIRDDRVTPPRKADRQAGQDRLCAGEFVLGYPREGSGVEGAGDAEGDEERESPVGKMMEPSPAWARNGSYLVFRRLQQDVRSFRNFVSEQAMRLGLSEDLMGAKLVGRYPSGAPLEALNTKVPVPGANLPSRPPAAVDPGRNNPDLLRDEYVNNFEFQADDAAGDLVPRAAHIRKIYPRDQNQPGEGVADSKRILRRGIPFGRSYREGVSDDDPEGAIPAFPDDRGLIFICYQSSIEDKFEFLQQTWVNDPDKPERANEKDPPAGHDPIIAQRDNPRFFGMPGTPKGHIHLLEQWVTTTGGDYFFSPSIDALRKLVNLA